MQVTLNMTKDEILWAWDKESKEQEILIKALKAANTQYLADLKITKDSITELLAKIGLINDKGQIGQMDFMMLSKTILNVMRMSDEKKKQEFACIANMIPVFEKYKDL